jgi:hypothetical protein
MAMVGPLRLGALVALAACLHPADALHCGDSICPASTDLCVDQTACVDTAALDACAGHGAETACEYPVGTPGWCRQHDVGLVCDPSVCGDGLIDDRTKEQCDGSATFDTQCVDLGFDIGRPSCATDRCELDSSSDSQCRKFEWDQIVNSRVTAMWSNGTFLAYVDPSGLHVVSAPGATAPFTLDAAGTFTQIAGHGDRFVVAGIDAISHRRDLFEVTASGLSATTFPDKDVDAVAVGGAGVYALSACGSGGATPVTLYAYTDHWESILTVPCSGLRSRLAISSTGVVYLAHAGAVYAIPPGTKTLPSPCYTFPSGDVFDLAVRTLSGTEAAFAVGPTQLGGDLVRIPLGQCSGNQLFQTAGGQYQLAFSDQAMFIVDSTSGHALRWDGKTGDLFRSPAPQITDDGVGHVYVYGGPIYRYSGFAISELEPPALESGEPVIAGASVTEPLFATDRQIFQLPLSVTWSATPWSYTIPSPLIGAIRAFSGFGLNSYVVAFYPDPSAPGNGSNTGVWLQESSIGTLQKIPSPASGDPRVDGLWMVSAGGAATMYAAGSSGGRAFLAKWVRSPGSPLHGTWFEDPKDGCEAHAVAGAGPDIVAVGACGGAAQVWHYNNATMRWDELQTRPEIGPLLGVAVFADGIFAVGDTGAVWSFGGVWHSDPAVIGRSVSGTSSNDVWIAGALTPVQHWDGQPWSVTGQAAWSRVTTHSLTQMVIIAQPNRIVTAGGAVGHVSLLRDPVP